MRRYAWLIFLSVLVAAAGCLIADGRREREKGSSSEGAYLLSVQDLVRRGERTEIRAKGVSVSFVETEEEILAGSVIKVYGAKKPVQELKSEGYARYLRSKGIRVTIAAKRVEVLGYEKTLPYYIGQIRRRLRRRIEDIFRAESPLIKALLYGERDEITSQKRELFSKTGMSHIIAISGFHIGMIAALVLRLCRRLPAVWRQMIAIAAVLFFVLVTGASPSAVRAGMFFLIGILAVRLRKEYDLISTTLVTASILMAWNPYIIYDRGFVLSFMGVFSIGIFYPIFSKRLTKTFLPRSIANLLALTLSVQMLILPLSYYYFGRISLVSIPANMLLVPLISTLYPVLFLTLIFFELPVIGNFLQTLSILLLEYFEKLNEWLSGLPMSYVDIEYRSVVYLIGIYVVISIWYVAVWKKIRKENENHDTGFETTYS